MRRLIGVTSIIYIQISVVVCHVKDLGEITENLKKEVLLIAGGKPVRLEAFPHNVQFLNRGGMCAATILTLKTVLTAAHCFDFNKNIGDMAIFSGSQFLLDRHRQHHEVWDFRIHPNYNTTAIFSDDIAVVFIHDVFVFSRDVKPATLIDTTEWMRENETTFITSGWGETGQGGELSLKGLMETNLRYVSRKKCMKIYLGIPFSRDMFCLYGNGTSDTCKGDSGSGVLWHNKVVGIVSHGRGCVTYPGVYTNVYFYTEWIKNITEEMFQLHCRFRNFG